MHVVRTGNSVSRVNYYVCGVTTWHAVSQVDYQECGVTTGNLCHRLTTKGAV